MSGRHVLAVALFALSLGFSLLAGPAPAGSAARGVISSDADIEAEGCVELECDEDQKADTGFTRFDKRASAFFRGANGKIKAHSSQDTSLFAPTGDLDRVVSTAAGDALFNQDPPDHRSSAFGGGRLDISFPVDSLTNYSVLGSMRASSNRNSECSQVRALLDPGPDADIFDFVAAAPAGVPAARRPSARGAGPRAASAGWGPGRSSRFLLESWSMSPGSRGSRHASIGDDPMRPRRVPGSRMAPAEG